MNSSTMLIEQKLYNTDEERSFYSKQAYEHLQAGEKLATKNGLFPTNGVFAKHDQDVATLCYHFSKYYNCIGQPENAFYYAAIALQIRTKVYFRLSSKIEELYTELDKAFNMVADKQKFANTVGMLESVHSIQSEKEKPLPPECHYYTTDFAGRTAAWLREIHPESVPVQTASSSFSPS